MNIRRIFLVTALLLGLATAQAQTLYPSPSAKQYRGVAPSLLQAKCDAGDAAAMTMLAKYYENAAMGVALDSARAFQLLQAASDKGFEDATLRLSYYYLRGSVVAPDTAKVLQLRQQVADKGNASGVAHLALCYEQGLGVEKDVARSASMVRQAALTGDAFALYLYGYDLFWGDSGFECNRSLGLSNMIKGYKAGCDRALGVLPHVYALAEDYKSALKWIETGRWCNAPEAQFTEGILYRDGYGVPRDEAKAEAIFQQLISTYHDLSVSIELANIYLFPADSTRRQVQRAISLLEEGAAQRNTFCLGHLGMVYGMKSLGHYDLAKSLSCFRQSVAIMDDYAFGNLHLAQVYRFGLDSLLPANLDSSLYYLKKAAGDGDALYELGEHYFRYAETPNLDTAEYYYLQAAAKGRGDAYLDLCQLAISREQSSLDYAQRAIQSGQPEGYYYQAVYYDEKQEGKAAWKALNQGAKQGSAACMLTMGDVYPNGYANLVKPSVKKALDCYNQAGRAGDHRGYYRAGRLYLSGAAEGQTPAALYKAIDLFHKAVELGSEEALYTLGYIYETESYGLLDYEKSLSFYRQLDQLGNPEGTFKIGLFYELGDGGLPADSVKAVEYYQRAAEEGHDGAKCYLADFYKLGRFLPLDEKKAYELYGEAADNGYLNGIYYVGKCQLMGTGTDIDTAQAVVNLRRAAQEGVGNACAYMGDFYMNGIYLERNADSAIYYYHLGSKDDNPTCDYQMGCYLTYMGLHDKAIEYYYSAAKNQHPDAIVTVARCFREGIGIQQDIQQAYSLFSYAAHQYNNADAYLELGICAVNGQGCVEDMNLAKTYFDTAANLGSTVAMYDLGLCYRDGDGCMADSVQSVQWFRRAADKGHTLSINTLAGYYEEGRYLPQQLDSAFALYQRGYDIGSRLCTFGFANCYELGHGTPVDMIKAVQLYAEAAEMGHAAAQYKLGLVYQYGEEGIPIDLDKAIHYYEQAAEQGYEPAVAALAPLKKGKKK